MTTRHYFVIAYADEEREKIKLVKISGWESTCELDLASRNEFDWYTLDEGDDPEVFNAIRREDEENEAHKAATYARELAAKHGLIYEPYNKRDGILD
jgi:hypothetical protein